MTHGRIEGCLLRLVLSLVAAAASVVCRVCVVCVCGVWVRACACAHRECLGVSSVPSLWLSVRIWTLPGRRVASELLSRSEAPPSALPDPSIIVTP